MATALCQPRSLLVTMFWLQLMIGWVNQALIFTAPLPAYVSVMSHVMPALSQTYPYHLQHQPPLAHARRHPAHLRLLPSNSRTKAAPLACATCLASGTPCGCAAARTSPSPSRTSLLVAASSPICFPALALTLEPVFAACEFACARRNRAASNAVFMHNAGINWGTYQDATCNLSGGCFHCNAHANNLVIIPPGALPDGTPGSTRLVR
jgi:hypothetical protein